MFKNYLKGIKAYGGTFNLISTLGLWRYFLVPMIISFITASIIGFAAWGWSDNLGALLAKIWIWDWGAETFRSISNFIGGVTIIALGIILYKHTVMALCAPFMSPVSEKIESHITDKEIVIAKNRFLPLLWRGIKVNGRNLIMELLFTIPILLLGFIPIIGLLSTPLLFLVQAYYAGFGNMDYTLERHLDANKSAQFVRLHSGLAMGNGTIFMLMLLIPIVGIILVFPLLVTAATTTTLEVLCSKEQKS